MNRGEYVSELVAILQWGARLEDRLRSVEESGPFRGERVADILDRMRLVETKRDINLYNIRMKYGDSGSFGMVMEAMREAFPASVGDRP